MNPSDTQTIEDALFQKMGVSVEDAIATGTDVVDEAVERAVDSGVQVDMRLAALGELIDKLTEPQTLAALGQLLESLPSLLKLAKLADEIPNVVSTATDVVDDYQQRCAGQGIDLEKALANGMQSVLYLGSQVDQEHLRRIGDLLASDVLNPHALNVVDNAAKSLNSAQEQVCGTGKERVGMFGLLAALRDPEVQRSLAFAIQFGKCFGRNLDK